MKQNQSRLVIAVLAAAVVILLVVVAFLLGRGSNSSGGAGTANGSHSLPSDSGAQTDPAAFVEEPKSLIVNMTAGSLTFKPGLAFDVTHDSKVIRVTADGSTLVIENAHANPSASQRRKMDVTVTVPENYLFENVDVSFGAGKLIVRSLSAKVLNLELGAGSATFDNLNVTESAMIQEGAGELVVRSGSLSNLTLRCGAGATRLAAALTGTNRVDAAFGAVDLDFQGRQEDYAVVFSMGLGACYFNNEKLARSGSFGEGPTLVDINGGFGVMRVNVG